MNRLAATELVARRVERGGDAVIGALLPVASAWPSGAGSGSGRNGELSGDGEVAHLGVHRRGAAGGREKQEK